MIFRRRRLNINRQFRRLSPHLLPVNELMGRTRRNRIDLDQIGPEKLNWIELPARRNVADHQRAGLCAFHRYFWQQPSPSRLRSGQAEDKGKSRPTFAARAQGQDRLLQDLPWAVGARFSRFLSDAAACRTAARISRQSAAGVYRSQAQQPCDVQRRARADPPMLKALAEHFKDLNPKPLGGGQRNSRRGKEDL